MPETYEYTPRVTRSDDGVYRWRYSVDMSSKGAIYASMTKVCAIIALIIIAGTAIIVPEIAVFISLAGLGIVALPAILWAVTYRGAAARQDMRFGMDEEWIYVPGLYKSERTAFSAIRGVEVRPDQDLIELRTATMTLIQVFAPHEDFDFVKEFIISHVSPMANVKAEA
ncbi:MAG: hypothetical protein IJ048_07410 [Clostridia bacterium]|nr:hypothetical protein [Clostridia bacterium]